MMFGMLGLVLFAQQASAIWNNIGFYHLRTNMLQYTTTTQSLYAGNCSGVMTVKTYNSNSVLINVTSNLTVNLTGAGTTTFYSDSSCTTAITSVTVTTGTNSASFYFIDTGTASISVTAAATSYRSASQTETLSTNPFVWVGLGGDANWNTAANWSGGVVPGSSNRTLFDGTCTSNCSPTINVAANVERIRMTSAYSGTITQAAGKTVTVGAGGWVQLAGTFSGSDSNITVSAPIVLLGGTFTSTSTTLSFASSFMVGGTATFNHHSGLLSGGTSYGTAQFTPGSAVYNNVKFTGYGFSVAINGTMQIDGDLTCDDGHGAGGSLTTGTINLKGNFSLTGGGWNHGGTALVRMVGTGTQTMTMALTGNLFPNIEIASTGTVVFNGQVNVGGNYTYTSGAVTTTGSTFRMNCSNTTCTVTPGTISYNNVELYTNAASIAIASGTTFKVGGNLTTSEFYGGGYGNLNTGTVEVGGNYTNTNFVGGSALVRMVGTGTVSAPAGSTPNIEINTAGTVTLSGTNYFGRSFTYVAGTVVTTGSTVYFTAYNMTATVTGGTIVFNNVTFSGDYSTMNISGTLNVGGNLTISETSTSSLNSGTIALQGNLTMTSLSSGGTASLNFTGTGTQTVSRTGGTWPSGNWAVNKASGSLVLGSAVSLPGAAQSVTLTAGAIDMAGYAFSMKSLSLNSTTLTKNAGVLTVNGVAQGTGPLFGGTVNP